MTTLMNIPQGYKSSPLGIIPKDWEVKRLGEVCRFLQTNTYSRAQMCDKGGEVNNIHYGDILTKYRSILDVRKTCIPFLLEENNVCNVLLQNGDIVMADTAEDEMVGKVCEIFGITKEKVVAGLHTIALRPQSKMFAACYLGYYMDSTCFHGRLIPYMQGIKVYSLTKSVIENSIIPLPPLVEQERIAELLGTWDKAIEMQKQLIDKLELRKKGLMQQLLTGKKRLPGFTGEWKKVRLGEVATIIMGQSPSSDFYNTEGNGIPLIQGNADIENRKSVARYYTSDITKTCKEGDIIMSVRAPVGAIGKATTKSCIGRGVCAIQTKNEYLYYLLIFIENQWVQYSAGSTFDSITSKDIMLHQLYIPSDAIEQNALVNIMQALNTEIDVNYKHLTYLQTQKKGLMQVLLTGKKRI